MRKRKNIFLMVCMLLCCMAMGCTKKEASQQGKETGKETGEEGSKEDPSGIRVTIWLDPESEYINHYVTGNYLDAKKKVAGSDVEQYYTDIQWELIDKSYLTPEQYRKELNDALEKGEGPDLIYMDGYNGISPEDMMASGHLAEIEDPTDWYGEDMEYFPGTLELGQKDGKQYVLPVVMECPVLFGIKEDLQETGIDVEDGYGSLQELLEALLKAQEKTGRDILENTEALDLLEQYYVDEKEEELLGLLEQVRKHCGNDDSTFAAYDALDGKTALLSGCGVKDCRKIGQNLCLLSESQQPAFLYVPASDGKKRAVIDQSVGINAGSEHIEEISQALLMYRYNTNSGNPTGMVPIADDHFWDGNLDIYAFSAMDLYDRKHASGVTLLSDKVKRTYKEFIYNSIEDAGYAVPPQEGTQAGQEAAAGQPERKVLTVIYEDMGLGDRSAVGQWLRQSAEAYNAGQEEYYVQLLGTGESGLCYSYSNMEVGGTQPDVVLFSEHDFTAYKMKAADISGLLQQHSEALSFLPDSLAGGLTCKGVPVGLPYAVKEYGIWYNKETLRNAGLSEDWKPKDLQELMDGLRILKKSKGVKTASVWESDIKALFAFMDPEHLDTYLKQDEEGEWRISGEVWAEFMGDLQQLRDEELTVPLEWRGAGITEEETAVGLVEGTVGAVLSNNMFGGWYDAVHGLELSEEQREQLVFVPLSPLADVDSFFISADCPYPEAAVEFWLTAVTQDPYAQLVKDDGGISAMGASETMQGAMPCQKGAVYQSDVVSNLWQLGKDAAEIAEGHQWFDTLEYTRER